MTGRRSFLLFRSIVSLAILVISCQARAQPDAPYDSNYVISYADQVTARTYLSQKYTIFAAEAPKGFPQLQYRPNTSVNLGVGATYRAVTLNLAYGFPFLNRTSDRGKTRYLDLQSHIYGYKWNFDIFGQFYKGYYLYPRGFAAASPDGYYKRPDLRVRELGFQAYYAYNHDQFSYRASFLQNAWQKKSAGSFLLGGGVTFGMVDGDSSFVPSRYSSEYPQRLVSSLKYLEIGPGLAYAYTLVYNQHWFLTAAAALSLDVGIVQEGIPGGMQKNINFSPNFLFRSVAGYNGPVWSVNVSWVTNRTSIRGEARDGGYHVTTGNYRFTIAKRFLPGNRMKRIWR